MCFAKLEPSSHLETTCVHNFLTYYTDAGDVAFVHHLTVGDNTDGRNQAIWARNRRSDDYELLCKDGTRAPIDNWERCYLGEVPAAAIVTAGFREKYERDIYWNLFSYGQQFFSSDM